MSEANPIASESPAMGGSTREERGVYTEYWGLSRKPFENTPDPDFLYYSDEHREALYYLNYAIQERKGGALLTGEYGCGKTTLIRVAVRNLKPEEYVVAVVNNPRYAAVELLKEILYQFGDEVVEDKRLELSRRIADRLFRIASQDAHALLVIDEAQLIKEKEALEEIRLLLNYQFEDTFLITVVMVGQPDLREFVREMPEFEQRLPIRYHLHSFDLENTANYVHHRMRVAGATRAIFSDEAIRMIFNATYGVPRRINNICDLCLLRGYARKADKIDADIVAAVM